MPRLLEGAKLTDELRPLKGWKSDGDFITRTFEFNEFMDGVRFIERVAKVAEELEHHPDIHVRYTTVRLELQTHSEGGVTEWDIELARAIDKVAAEKKTTSRR